MTNHESSFRFARILLLGLLLFGWCEGSAPAQPDKRQLTLEWIFGPEGRSVASVPATAWLDDGTLIILDNRRSARESTFEKLNPTSGQRQSILDSARALADLKSAAGVEADVLPWPIAFDGSGKRALYIFRGDVFVLDIPDARFRRLTSTAPEETSASFSPNGRRVAYVRDNDLYFFDLDTNRETRITRDGSETLLNGTLSWVYWEEVFGRRDIGYWWAPDSQAIAYLQSDDSQVDLAYFTDIAPFSPRVIRQRYARAGRANPRVRLGIAELENPSTTWIQITDKPFEYIVRATWLPDGRHLSFETMPRLQTELSLYFGDRKSGATHRILTESDPGWVNMTDDLYFFSDGNHLLWPSERDGYMHLYRYRMDGTLANQVTKGPWALASAGGIAYWVRQALVGVDEKNDWIYFTALERSSIERHLYRVHADGSGFTRISKEPGTHRISMSPDVRYFLDTYSDIRTLPALRLHASDGSTLQTIASPRSQLIAPYDVQFPELSTIPADDGFPMPAQILRSKTFRPNHKFATIMFVYGGPAAPRVSDSWQQDALWNQLLLDAGYIVVKVDNRSATAISKQLENTVVKRLGESETPDLVAAARWLKKQAWVDPQRVGVWGWSYGGWMTLNLMTRSQEFKAGIAVAPVTDWRYYDSKWTEGAMRTPQENSERYASTSVVPRAKDLHGHLLIVYGTYDDNVHPYNEMAFIDALVAAGKKFDMMAYPMRKHGITDEAATLHLYRLMLDFWKRNL
ncbi:MAG TPA: S9 family peptidase [Blastocatellia bacterium]|nr:S9 family peptidase [Blastocatellia bacterium]